MNFLRSRAELLADMLRSETGRDDLVEPLPDMRTWSNRLGISRTVLTEALQILQREGLVSIRPRKGVLLVKRPATKVDAQPGLPKLVRFLYSSRDHPNLPYLLYWLGSLLELLGAQGIHLSLEGCSSKRLRAISRTQQLITRRPRDLLLLHSMSVSNLSLFLGLQSSALALGVPPRGIALSYVGSDITGAIRHATQMMLRQGFSIVNLIVPKVSAASTKLAEDAFLGACVGWPHQPVQHEIIRLPLSLELLVPAAQRFASRIKARQAIIALSPIAPATVLTALLSRGISVPRQVQIVAVLSSPEAVKLCPVPSHYPYPADNLIKTISKIVTHYFESGTLPRIHKVLPVNLKLEA